MQAAPERWYCLATRSVANWNIAAVSFQKEKSRVPTSASWCGSDDFREFISSCDPVKEQKEVFAPTSEEEVDFSFDAWKVEVYLKQFIL